MTISFSHMTVAFGACYSAERLIQLAKVFNVH